MSNASFSLCVSISSFRGGSGSTSQEQVLKWLKRPHGSLRATTQWLMFKNHRYWQNVHVYILEKLKLDSLKPLQSLCIQFKCIYV